MPTGGLKIMDPIQLAKDIEQVSHAAYEELIGLSEKEVQKHPAASGWSPKEIIGHLIDSASNNHQRWVRLQISERLSFPDYGDDNDRWVRIQQYETQDWKFLIGLWRQFNLHMSSIVKYVDKACLANAWIVDENTSHTLSELMVDYPLHLKEHLEQIRRVLGSKSNA